MMSIAIHRAAGRWRMAPSEWQRSKSYLVRDEQATDEPVIMLRADGTGSVTQDGMAGKWWLLTVGTFLGREGQIDQMVITNDRSIARGENYYYHDYVGVLTVDDNGSCQLVPLPEGKGA